MRKYSSVVQEYLKIFAYGIFFGTTFLGILAYKGMPVSLWPRFGNNSLFFILLFSVLLFSKKNSTAKKILALCMIVMGIVVYALG